MAEKRTLSAQEQVFVDEYLLCLKPEQAAIKAGYAESTAKSKAYTWVSEGKCPKNKMHVFEAIQAAKAKRSEETKIDSAWLLKRLALIADFNINRFITTNSKGDAYYDFSEATDDDWYCITELTSDQIFKGSGDDMYEVDRVKLKTMDRMKALELIGRHVEVQAFRDRAELEVVDRKSIIEAARRRLINGTK